MSPACQRSISFVHIVVGKEGGPYSVEVQEQFARLRALERLQTVYVSGVLDDADNPVDDEEEGGRPDDGAFSARLAWTYRGRSTWHLLRTLEQRSIRAVLCLDAYSERFARVYVRAGRWRKMARRFCGCCGKTAEVEADRERMYVVFPFLEPWQKGAFLLLLIPSRELTLAYSGESSLGPRSWGGGCIFSNRAWDCERGVVVGCDLEDDWFG